MSLESPSWLKVADSERVEWLNSLLTALWPYITLATKDLLTNSIQPLLDASRPSFLTHLKFSNISLGSTAPSIVGIRMCDTDEDCVRLDLEIKWAGEPTV
jgi:Ca2+-dependent lipid-binding protein